MDQNLESPSERISRQSLFRIRVVEERSRPPNNFLFTEIWPLNAPITPNMVGSLRDPKYKDTGIWIQLMRLESASQHCQISFMISVKLSSAFLYPVH